MGQASRITVEEFRARSLPDAPRLFTHVRDFRFHHREGKLVHRTISCGPKGYRLVAIASTGHDAHLVEADRVAVTLRLAGRAMVRVEGRTIVTEPGDLFAIGPCERSVRLAPLQESGLYSSYTIILPSRESGAFLDGCWLHRPKFRSFRQFRHLIEMSFRLAESGPSEDGLAHVAALIEDELVHALANPVDNHDCERRDDWYEWIVHVAKSFMEANLTSPMSIRDIACSCGVGTRTLQLAFRNRRNVTPKRLLSEMRLRAMRVRLTCPQPATTVTSATLDSGILHVGRGIQAYRKRYRETPSETLRRARISKRTMQLPEFQ